MPRQYLRSLQFGWKLFKCDFNNSINYFRRDNINNELISTREYVNNIRQPSVVYTNTSYIYFTNEIIYNNIKQKDSVWKFCNLLDGLYYDVYNVVFLDNEIVIFFLNELNPIIIIQCFCYMEIYYIGYIDSRILFQINHSTSGADMKLPFIENYLEHIVFSSKIKTNISVKTKQFLFFGFCGNIGHHLFNEISGLLIFLNNPEIFSKIHGICIGPYDFFNIQEILANKYKFNIIHLNNTNSYLTLNIFPIFLNSFILEQNTIIPFFDELLNNYNKLNTSELCTTDKKDKTLKIVFDIRTVSRILTNMEDIYIKLIIYIYETYCQKYNIVIIFTGRFTTNINNINILNDTEYIQQMQIMNNIIAGVNISYISYQNLIGQHILFIMNKIRDLNFCIYIAGTCSSNLMNWIYRKKGISFCNTSFYTLCKDMQYDCLQNYDAVNPPVNCVTDTTNGNFRINYDPFLSFFINLINSYGL